LSHMFPNSRFFDAEQERGLFEAHSQRLGSNSFLSKVAGAATTAGGITGGLTGSWIGCGRI
jgi:hypothetical protein